MKKFDKAEGATIILVSNKSTYMLKSKTKILVTGASGYVGAAIYDYLKKNYAVKGTYQSHKLFPELMQLDVTDANRVNQIVQEMKPDFIVHAAANPNAKWCEANPKEAVRINEEGTLNIVRAANYVGAKIIYISSFAAVINPKNLIYGKTKLAGEEISKDTKAGWVVLRPAHIIGYSPNTTNDRQINRFLKNISEKAPVSYDNSWKFQPTELEHVSRIIEACIKMNLTNETIPAAVPELKTRFDLARDIMTPFGIEVNGVDEKNASAIFEQNLDKLKDLNLPTVKYEETISRIISDIKIYWLSK